MGDDRIDNDNSTVTITDNDETDCDSIVSGSIIIGPLPTVPAPLAPPCGHLEDEDDDDDEDSITLGSNSTASSICAASSPSSTPTRRTISFPPDESIARYHEGADMAELADNRRDIWYQYEELKNIKRKALSVSKEAQRYGLGHILTNTYGKNCQETQDALNLWARNGSCRRGLERWINDEYAAKRSDIRKRTIQSVLRAQSKMKDSALNDPEYASKVLSRLSEAFSIDSMQFARGMGIADSLAVQEQERISSSTVVQEDTTKKSVVVVQKKTSSASIIQRKHSPNSVMAALTAPPSKSRSRNLGLTAPSVSADFRHYY